MVIGIIMVKVVPGQEKAAYSFLKDGEGISSIYHVFGEYDFLIMLRAEGLARLNRFIETIRKANDIIAVKTILAGWDIGLQEHKAIKDIMLPSDLFS